MKKILLISFFCCFMMQYNAGAVYVAKVFSHNMVLQRGVEIPIWGTASAGEKITIKFNGVTKTIKADDVGKWYVKIGAFKAGGPFIMTVSGDSSVKQIENILIGDVWVCSGQSNMQFKMKDVENAEDEIIQAGKPNIRFCIVSETSVTPREDLSWVYYCKGWKMCMSDTVPNLSAVAYYFACELRQDIKVPIGIILNAEGSTPIRSWISSDEQYSNPVFKETLEGYKTYAEEKKVYTEKRNAYNEALKKSKIDNSKPPVFPGFFEAYGDAPGLLYNARIAPLAQFAIKGVIWYQGENEALYNNSDNYYDYFAALIKDWRHLWGQRNLPFIFVQLAPFNGQMIGVGESEWANVRDAQRRTLSVSNTGMAVATDICEAALHPKKKKELGKRLAHVACTIAYGEDTISSGPLYDGIKFADGKAVISFADIGAGLIAKGGALKGFIISGVDGKFVNARASIDGNKVVAHSSTVKEPVAVRYNWENNPTGNLFNKNGFPASCFKTD